MGRKRALPAAAVLLALAGPARAADISAYLLEQLKDFSTFQQSQVGASPELMKLVVEQVSADVEKEQAPPAPSEPEFDLEKASLETLERLSFAYSTKRRPTFLKLVSEEYMGDIGLLEDALRADFRAYRTIDLKLVPDKVTVQGDTALVDVHYLMRVTDDVGASNLFEGNTQFTFRRERTSAMLLRMAQPLIFGTQLPPDQYPTSGRQGASASGGGTAPGAAQDIVTGNATLRLGSNGYKFDSAAESSEASSDVKQVTPSDMAPSGGASIKSLGSCSLSGVDSVPSSGYVSGTVAANIGECYAVRTALGRYAVMRLSSVSASGIRFDFKYNRKSGLTTF